MHVSRMHVGFSSVSNETEVKKWFDQCLKKEETGTFINRQGWLKY